MKTIKHMYAIFDKNGNQISKLYTGVGSAKRYITDLIKNYTYQIKKGNSYYNWERIKDYKIVEFKLTPTNADYSEFAEKKIKKAMIESKLENL